MSVQEVASFGTIGFNQSVICERVVSFNISWLSMCIENWDASNEGLNLFSMDSDGTFELFTNYPNVNVKFKKNGCAKSRESGFCV